ncbi:Stromal cell-derived factor 2-like protein [Smittium mucronatum]|uniref:Stromal cell-derived factor 2-like protein n=1 Tax=Smittium mucronatum TaxID=133383 RepID=A0A1R0GRR4_9FUNG|nr:Stromal cell-derived factor 2-like protein [Smittium mucronatum]
MEYNNNNRDQYYEDEGYSSRAPAPSVYGENPRPSNSSEQNQNQGYGNPQNHQSTTGRVQGQSPRPMGYQPGFNGQGNDRPRPNLGQTNYPNPGFPQNKDNVYSPNHGSPRPENFPPSYASSQQSRPGPDPMYSGPQGGRIPNQGSPAPFSQNNSSPQSRPGMGQPMNNPAYNMGSKPNQPTGGFQQNSVSSGGYSQEEIEESRKKGEKNKWMGIAAGSALGIGAAAAVGAGIYAFTKDDDDNKQESPNQQRWDSNDDRKDGNYYQGNNTPQNDFSYQQNSGQGNQSYNNYEQGYNRPQDGHSRRHNDDQYRPENDQHHRHNENRDNERSQSNQPNQQNNNQTNSVPPFVTSQGSATPREYPMIRQNANDTEIRIGTVLALKHNMTGRFLHSDSSKISLSGSNQQMVYCHLWNTDDNDWWQVIPANQDVIPPGQKVTYGSVIRLLHVSSSRHLHSHTNFFCPKTKQNEVTCFGDLDYSDSNDHWVVERHGADKHYGEIWSSNEAVVFRHQQSGLTLHSHEVMYSENVQSVTAFGDGHEENDKWRIYLTQQ